MDEVPTRRQAEAHAKAVVEGDEDAVTNDFIPDMRGRVSDIVAQLPVPTTNAEVKSVDIEDDRAAVVIEYSNDQKSVRFRSFWEERHGRPMIVDGEPVED
jgi:hypothetical protein